MFGVRENGNTIEHGRLSKCERTPAKTEEVHGKKIVLTHDHFINIVTIFNIYVF